MSHKLIKPVRKTYWFATDTTGVLHTGVTEPGQVTESGLPSMDHDADVSKFLDKVRPHASLLEELPDEEEVEVVEDAMYRVGGNVVLSKVSKRIKKSEQLTKHFYVRSARP